MTSGSAVRQRKNHVERSPKSASILAMASAERGCWSTSCRKIKIGSRSRGGSNTNRSRQITR